MNLQALPEEALKEILALTEAKKKLDIREKDGIILTKIAAIKVINGVNSLILFSENVRKIIINKTKKTVVISKKIFGK